MVVGKVGSQQKRGVEPDASCGACAISVDLNEQEQGMDLPVMSMICLSALEDMMNNGI